MSLLAVFVKSYIHHLVARWLDNRCCQLARQLASKPVDKRLIRRVQLQSKNNALVGEHICPWAGIFARWANEAASF